MYYSEVHQESVYLPDFEKLLKAKFLEENSRDGQTFDDDKNPYTPEEIFHQCVITAAKNNLDPNCDVDYCNVKRKIFSTRMCWRASSIYGKLTL